jgi:hypothetical protein
MGACCNAFACTEADDAGAFGATDTMVKAADIVTNTAATIETCFDFIQSLPKVLLAAFVVQQSRAQCYFRFAALSI